MKHRWCTEYFDIWCMTFIKFALCTILKMVRSISKERIWKLINYKLYQHFFIENQLMEPSYCWKCIFDYFWKKWRLNISRTNSKILSDLASTFKIIKLKKFLKLLMQLHTDMIFSRRFKVFLAVWSNFFCKFIILTPL